MAEGSARSVTSAGRLAECSSKHQQSRGASSPARREPALLG